MRPLIFLSLSWLLCFCKNDANGNLKVMADHTAMYDAAGLHSNKLKELKAGEVVHELGIVGPFESAIEWHGAWLQSPWIRVQSDGGAGWVMAALLKPSTGVDHANWLRNKRLVCYFGASQAHRYTYWISGASDIQTDAQMASWYSEGVALRDTFMYLLSQRAEPSEQATALSYNWMREVLPGYIAQKVPNRISSFLFADYGYWLQEAQKTTGDADDQFFEICTTLFPYDHIESFFPVWKFQLDDQSSVSQLGSGKHLQILRLLEEKSRGLEVFHTELIRIKNQLLDDIAGKDIGYWQNEEKILAELDEISKSNFSILDKNDQLVIQTRMNMLADPQANGIRVNLRSGL
ncbi:MAG: hypothetical protein JNM22_07905 [Saprospiraceae bacterium]|nr:hypothetical protein [Saprospiraceae bacterium]